jgi:hypothetical protein
MRTHLRVLYDLSFANNQNQNNVYCPTLIIFQLFRLCFYSIEISFLFKILLTPHFSRQDRPRSLESETVHYVGRAQADTVHDFRAANQQDYRIGC